MSDAFHAFEHAGWERASVCYASTFGALTELAAEPLLDAVGATTGTKLLDVATGPGYVAAAAARRGATCLGIDFSEAMLADARRLYPALEFRLGDAEALDLPNDAYDAVVMSFGLLHLGRPEAALAEGYRVLAPGGRYAFTVWDLPERARGFGIILEALRDHGAPVTTLPDGPPFFRFADPAEARRALEAAGFRDVEIRIVPLAWKLPSPQHLFEAGLRGGVRTSAILRAQTPEALAAIERAVVEAAKQLDAIPMPIVLASGRK